MRRTITQFTTLLLISLAMLANAASAQTFENSKAIETLDACLGTPVNVQPKRGCLGRVAWQCEPYFPSNPVIAVECWEAELFAWDRLLNASYNDVIADVRANGYGDYEEPIRMSQRHWLDQMRLDCQLEIASNPRRYDDVLWAACKAAATMERFLFIQQLEGADWTSLPDY